MVFWSGIAPGRMEEPCFSSQILSNFLGAQMLTKSRFKKNCNHPWSQMGSLPKVVAHMIHNDPYVSAVHDPPQHWFKPSVIQNIQGVVVSSALRDGEVHHKKYSDRLIAIGNQRHYHVSFALSCKDSQGATIPALHRW